MVTASPPASYSDIVHLGAESFRLRDIPGLLRVGEKPLVCYTWQQEREWNNVGKAHVETVWNFGLSTTF